MARVVFNFESVQYDGTNGDHICDTWLTGCTKVSDNGSVLVYEDGTDHNQHVVNLGDYVIRHSAQDPEGRVQTPSQYASNYHEL